MWDNFFYYDSVAVEDMNRNDLSQLLIQSPNSLYYNRVYGVDLNYNAPQSSYNQMILAYSIAKAVANRNSGVVDGSASTIDRRVAVSQTFISVDDSKTGERNISIYYFNYANYKKPVNLNVVV